MSKLLEVQTHALPVRLAHWAMALATLIMVGSGWRIYDSTPIFAFQFPYWMTLGGDVQIALARGAGAVVGVDLLPVEPLGAATLFEMDFTDPACGPLLIEALGGAPDLVMSDMAPNTVGHRQTDHLRIVGLVEAAVDFAVEVLKPGGAFVTKAFQGGETAGLLKVLNAHFDTVKHVKPKASRAESSELYLVATGFKGR